MYHKHCSAIFVASSKLHTNVHLCVYSKWSPVRTTINMMNTHTQTPHRIDNKEYTVSGAHNRMPTMLMLIDKVEQLCARCEDCINIATSSEHTHGRTR